jgi:hypothetical protein
MDELRILEEFRREPFDAARVRGTVRARLVEAIQAERDASASPRHSFQVARHGLVNQGLSYMRHARHKLGGMIGAEFRRRHILAAAVAVVVAGVAAGAALGGVQQVLNWFEGTSPNATVQQDYIQWKAAAAARNYALANANMAADAPTVDLSTVHGVLALQLTNGPAYLWSGDLSDGGACWLVQVSGESAGADLASAGDCITSQQAGTTSLVEVLSSADGSLLVLGRAPNATTASLATSDGTTINVPVVEGYFLASLTSGDTPQDLTTYDASGNQVGHETAPASLPTKTTSVGSGG